MPYAHRDMDTIVAIISREYGILNDVFIVVIEHYSHLAPYKYERFSGISMAMDGNNGSWLHGIEEAMSCIFKALMEIVVHPQARGILGSGGNLI